MIAAPIEACWTRIGIDGDRTCVELRTVVHCRNCARYAEGGRLLLERPAPLGYLEEWAAELAAVETTGEAVAVSTVVFRLGTEHFALPTATCAEIVEQRAVHRIPHRSGTVLRGLVNVGGELHLCVSLADLLGIADTPGGPAGGSERRRLVVIARDGERWVFPVDALLGVERVAEHALEPPPATVARDAAALTSAVFALAERRVALLDTERLFVALRHAVA